MRILTDESVPTVDQARLLAARHDDALPCRKEFLNALSTVRPDAVPPIADNLASNDQVLALLVERKISWGEAARQSQKSDNEMRDKIAAADQQWRSQLNAENDAELARRQAAANAIMQWSAEQQMINAATRPVVTNCNRFGSSVNCTSY